MKKVLLTLLGIIVAVGLLATAGFAGYRLGFAQGARITVNANSNAPRPQEPQVRPFNGFGPRGMPFHNFGFGRGIRRGFGMGGFPMMGFGFFGPLMFLGRILILGLVIWFIYWLFTRSGWHLVRTAPVTNTPPPTTASSASATETENTNTDVNP
jgi:hypothetical protein